MHRLCTQVVAFTALSLSVAGAHALELRGFRGIPWGADVAQLGPSEQVSIEGDVSCHTRVDENLLFGNISLKSIHYCFNKGQFFLVKIESKVSSKTLSDEFQRTYGPPTELTPKAFIWGQDVGRSRAEVSSLGGSVSSLRLIAKQLDVASSDALIPNPPAAGRR